MTNSDVISIICELFGANEDQYSIVQDGPIITVTPSAGFSPGRPYAEVEVKCGEESFAIKVTRKGWLE